MEEQKAFFVADAKRLHRETQRRTKFADFLAAQYERFQKTFPRPRPLDRGEYQSWVYSLPPFAQLLIDAGLTENHIVIVEGILQIRDRIKRIDTIVCGQQEDGAPSVMLNELKRWNDSNGFSVTYSSLPRYVRLLQHGEFYREEEHPSIKIGICRNVISHRLGEALGVKKSEVGVRGFSIFDQQKENFNEDWNTVLHARRYKNEVKGSFPAIITANRMTGIKDNISRYIGSGEGQELSETILEKILGYNKDEIRINDSIV